LRGKGVQYESRNGTKYFDRFEIGDLVGITVGSDEKTASTVLTLVLKNKEKVKTVFKHYVEGL